MPSPFIKIYERGRHTPQPGLRPSISAELLICRMDVAAAAAAAAAFMARRLLVKLL
jgi:hypothetical protein